MTICTIIGATILNCAAVAPLPPATAVHVLTSNTRPWTPPPPMPSPYEMAMRDTPMPAPNPYSPFLTPATPIAPLSEPWSYTTYVGRGFAVTRPTPIGPSHGGRRSR